MRGTNGPSHIGLKFLDGFSLQTLETKLKQQELAAYFLVDSNEDCWLQQRKNRMLRPTIEIEINFKNWISAQERLDFDQKYGKVQDSNQQNDGIADVAQPHPRMLNQQKWRQLQHTVSQDQKERYL